MPNKNRSYILQAFIEKPWAILPAKLAILQGIVERYVSGETLDAEEVQTTIHGAARSTNRLVGNVAILPLFGSIFPRANLMTAFSGATSAETFGKEFADLVNNPQVSAIVLDVDSPGGQVSGIEELSKQIFDARGSKPIVAVANHMIASAAYWIASAADEIIVSPSGEVGSIGVFALHQDISVALEQDGIKLTFISEGKYKTEGNPYEVLGEEAHAAIQESVSETYDTFINAIARNRDIKAALVRTSFGEGRMVSAKQAVELGMADSIATLDETVSRLLAGATTPHKNSPQGALDFSSEVAEQTEADVEKEEQAKCLRNRITEIRSEYK
jgi:signal peptide peptidase SppA